MDELQKTFSELAKQNESLKNENAAFRQEIILLQSVVVGNKAQQPFLYQSSTYRDDFQTSLGVNDVPRRPSPIESFNVNQLNPDRIFPIGGDQQPANERCSESVLSSTDNSGLSRRSSGGDDSHH
jgi:hypothetical protein